MQALTQPLWLKKRINYNSDFVYTKNLLEEFGLNTVCQSARCPNIFDCFSKKTATFLILGDTCTRNCSFCAVKKGKPRIVDEDEPEKIAEAVARLGLRHVVITSVTRDDLSDGGSCQFAKVIEALRKSDSKIKIEILVPDFKGNRSDIKRVIDAGPDIFSHNVETAPRLYKETRPHADYERSLDVLGFAKESSPNLETKSGFMLGLGETEEEAVSIMEDLRSVNCDMLAIGQYLRPSVKQIGVKEFIEPARFLKLKEIGLSLGFKDVKSGPFVRSSLL